MFIFTVSVSAGIQELSSPRFLTRLPVIFPWMCRSPVV
jgi:hypothetical protein